MHHAIVIRSCSKDPAPRTFPPCLTSHSCRIARYYMTVTKPSERADLIADPTHHGTADVSNHKTLDLDQLRGVATVQGSRSNFRRCNRTQARAGGLVDGTWISYVPPAYEICPLGSSSRRTYSSTDMAQRNVQYSKRASSRLVGLTSYADHAVPTCLPSDTSGFPYRIQIIHTA